MPAKFNLFKVACIVNLILIAGYMIVINYFFFVYATINRDFGFYLLFMAVLGIYAWNYILGLGMLKRYRNQTGITKAFAGAVIVLFILQLILQLIIGFAIIDELIRYDYEYLEYAYYRRDFWFILVTLIPMTVILITIYSQIMTFPLMMATKRRQADLLKELDHLGNS